MERNGRRRMRWVMRLLTSYDANDRLLSENGITYDWDINGNMLSKTENGITTAYSWDTENRLIGIQSPSNAINYAYNADGIRVQTDANGAITNYLIDGNRDYAQVLQEWDANNSLIASYEYGDDLISQIRSDQFSYYHYDAIGSTRSLTNDLASISDTYNYEAFGNMLQRTGNTANNYLFVGEQFDPYSELNYFRARYYDPKNGLFNSMDPIKPCMCCPKINSSYVYANQNPTRYIDPSGEQIELLLLNDAIRNTILNIAQGALNVLTHILYIPTELKCSSENRERLLIFARDLRDRYYDKDDCSAMADIYNEAALLNANIDFNHDCIVRDVMAALTEFWNFADFTSHVRTRQLETRDQWSDAGFKLEFQEEPHIPRGARNQVRHATAFFAAGYIFGLTAAGFFSFIHDETINPSEPDVALGIAAAGMGQAFRTRIFPAFAIGAYIECRFCDPFTRNP
jgi:RHS repeat-associated protein